MVTSEIMDNALTKKKSQMKEGLFHHNYVWTVMKIGTSSFFKRFLRGTRTYVAGPLISISGLFKQVYCFHIHSESGRIHLHQVYTPLKMLELLSSPVYWVNRRQAHLRDDPEPPDQYVLNVDLFISYTLRLFVNIVFFSHHVTRGY